MVDTAAPRRGPALAAAPQAGDGAAVDGGSPGVAPAPAPQGLLRTALRSAVLSLAGFLFPAILSLATTPWLIRHAGEFPYGLWMLAATVFGFAGLLDLGIGAALVRSLAACAARPERAADARAYLETSLAYYVVAGGAAGGALALAAGPIARALAPRATGADAELAARCVLAMAACFPVVMLGNAATYALTAHQRYGWSSGLVAVRSAANSVVAMALVLGGRDMPAILYATAACWLAVTAVGLGHVRTHLIRFSLRPRFSPRHFRELFGFGGLMLVAQTLGTVRVSADRYWLSHLLGPATVTPYSVSLSFANRLHGLASSSLNMVFPLVATLREGGDDRREALLYERAYGFGAVLTGSVAVTMAVLARPFLALWYSAEFGEAQHLVFSALVVAYFLLALVVAPYYALSGRGDARALLLVELGTCAVMLVAAPWAVARFGELGAALALGLANALGLPWLGLLYERRSARRTGTWWKVPLGAVSAFALVAGAGYPLAARFVGGWLSLFAAGGLVASIALVVFSFAVLAAPVRRATWARLAARVRRATVPAGGPPSDGAGGARV